VRWGSVPFGAADCTTPAEVYEGPRKVQDDVNTINIM
jgi:hypothetical protein